MSSEQMGGTPPQNKLAIESEQSEAQRFAENYVKQQTEEIEKTKNTLHLLDNTILDLSSINSPEDLSPAQKKAVQEAVEDASFLNYKMTAERTENLLKKGLIDYKQASLIIKQLLESSTARYIPLKILEDLAKETFKNRDESLVKQLTDIKNSLCKEVAGLRKTPHFDTRLIYATKAYAYGTVAEQHLLNRFSEKKELNEEIKADIGKLFAEDGDKVVSQWRKLNTLLITEGRNMFEFNAIPPEKIPEMFQAGLDLMRENPQYKKYATKTKEAVIDFLRMGKIDEPTAKKLLEEVYELTK